MSERMSDEEIHARLAPFAGSSQRQMDRFNQWQDEGNRRPVNRARAWARLERWLRDQLRVHGKDGGTKAGAMERRRMEDTDGDQHGGPDVAQEHPLGPDQR